MCDEETVTLMACGAQARVSRFGAEWRAWRVGEAELLWPGDPASWPQSAPILFPICGWTHDGIRVDGARYALGLHGFAQTSLFTLEACDNSRARFTLGDDARTRALYPFAFELAITYALSPDAMTITLDLRNPGARPMPYALGLHPGFRWPFAGGAPDAYEILFDESEASEVPVIAPGGLFSDRRRPVAIEGRRLALRPETFAREALCFLDAASCGLAFQRRGGGAIRMDVEGFPHLVLWSRPGAPFLCLEAWTGYGDPEGFAGELAAKPSMLLLAPGAEATHGARFAFAPA